jgi:ribosome maturation factor RimP
VRAQSELEIRILDMIEPEAKAMGLDVVRVRVMGARTPVLQIMAEKADGTMDVEDCAKFSRRISPVLETEDPISGEYALEVSSPGIDRPLTREGDFAKWAGHEVKAELGTPTADGRKRFHGWIAGETDGVVELKLKDGGEARLAVADMVKAHLVLTDRLIQEARARGQADIADLDDEEIASELAEDFDDVEIDDGDPEGDDPEGNDIDADAEPSAVDKRE